MLLAEPVTVPRLALAQAWEWERVGAPHPVIGMVDVWLEDDIVGRFEDLTRQVLAEPGFYDLRRGRFVGEFRDLLLATANAESECYCFSSTSDGQSTATLAVPAGRSAIRYIVDGDRVTLEKIPRHRLIRAVVESLTACAPADIRQFSVARSEYESSGDGEAYSLDTTSDYTAPDSAEQLRTAMTARRIGGHQFYVASRTNRGRVTSMPLTAVDTAEHGRFLTYLQDGPGGEEITCGPGSLDYITGTLENTLQALQ
ncbi:ESX secretion-associated protein EspG [Amycolatopsis sp. NBC_01480]|uniref:ESX secretion-associated protein EspG n=1 Tax=Amycolatopsis sp. NBC_01480 TaxID=2903562 RepID=UPI002E2B0E18|nr:ESX secretion-associated protein EspG [Amycolatopsis sp. NBC_01480]